MSIELRPLTVGIWLSGLLKEKNVSQVQLANMTQLSKITIHNIVNDKHKRVRNSTILSILRALFSDNEDRMVREYQTFKILQPN